MTAPLVFFHMTPGHLVETILQNGLDPAFTKSSMAAVFLSGTRETAQNYEWMKSRPCAMLKVTLPSSMEAHLAPDNYELNDLLYDMTEAQLAQHGLFEGAGWRDCDWRQSLAICDQVACTTMIEASCIEVLALAPRAARPVPRVRPG